MLLPVLAVKSCKHFWSWPICCNSFCEVIILTDPKPIRCSRRKIMKSVLSQHSNFCESTVFPEYVLDIICVEESMIDVVWRRVHRELCRAHEFNVLMAQFNLSQVIKAWVDYRNPSGAYCYCSYIYFSIVCPQRSWIIPNLGSTDPEFGKAKMDNQGYH